VAKKGKRGRNVGRSGNPGWQPTTSGLTNIPTANPQTLTCNQNSSTQPPADSQYLVVLRRQEAAKRLEQFLVAVANDMNVSPARLAAVYEKWKDPDSIYENVEAPDPKFQYNPETLKLSGDPNTKRALRKLGYEHFLAQPYPVFVYGTLRQGQGNSGLMNPAVDNVTTGRLKGVAIYGADHGFPYAAEHEDPSAVTVGELVVLKENNEGDYARYRLDRLEGFNSDHPNSSHYERVLTKVYLEDEDDGVKAWTYLARGFARETLVEKDRIVDGDWVSAKVPPRTYWNSSPIGNSPPHGY